jgi:hypothetical protein
MGRSRFLLTTHPIVCAAARRQAKCGEAFNPGV